MIRAIASPLGTLALAAGTVTFIALVDPNEQGHYPTCPFLVLTGLQCPGCGSLRALHALAHGHVAEAVSLNVFTVAMLPVLVFFWTRWTVAAARGRPARTRAGDPRPIWALFALVMAFWLLRNLPVGAPLAA
jgi:hypothetical protein